MPRPRSRYPSYRLHRPSGHAVVTIAGQDHYLGPYDSDERRAVHDRLVMEWIAAGRPRYIRRSRDLTVAELCDAFWQYRKSKRQPNGQPSGELAPFKSVIRLLRRRYGKLAVVKFRPRSLRALRLYMIERKRWSRKNINRQILRIRHIFRWGASEELCTYRIYRRLQMVQGLASGEQGVREKAPVKAIDDASVKSTLSHLPTVVQDMVQLQLLTGARPDEICSLRPIDIDRSGKVWRYRPIQHKNLHRGHERIVLVGRKGQQILKRYLDRPADSFCFSPADSERLRLADVHRRRKTPLKHGNRPGSNRRSKPKLKPGDRYTTVRAPRSTAGASCVGSPGSRSVSLGRQAREQLPRLRFAVTNPLRSAAWMLFKLQFSLQSLSPSGVESWHV